MSGVGTIVRLIIGQSYGFIRLGDRREVFFHRADVQEGTPQLAADACVVRRGAAGLTGCARSE
jgi:cold shock CspA family protein